MKIIIFIFLMPLALLAQIENFSGVLNHDNYFKNPKNYLSNLDSNKIETGVLIDRVLYSNSVINNNGLSKVTTLDYGDFFKIFNVIKYAQNDSIYIPKFDSLLQISRLLYKTERINLIPIIDYQFNRITQESLDNGEFIQNTNFLDDNNASKDSYSSERVVAFSCFKYNIFGSKIKFLVHEDFIFSNQNNLMLSSIEIDFGNGGGFQTVTLNDVVTVNYSGEGDYVELKVKLNYFNKINNDNESVYAHSSIYRKDDNGIPVPSPIDATLTGQESLNSESVISYTDNSPVEEVINPDRILYYPYYYYDEICPIRGVCTNVLRENKTGELKPLSYGTLEISILFSPVNRDDITNASKKLRKPFIIVDGFDPGNIRDYYETVRDSPDDLLEKEKDFRGIYEILNGKRSPWDDNSVEESFLGNKLREDGYDLIFVNFTDGAGDIFKNAQFLRQFLNDIVNGSLRDNKTEEIVMVGPSMGGLITRIALTEMEKSGIEHYVKSWISFDSPHKGASMPIAMQHAVYFATKFNTVGFDNPFNKSLEALNSTAAKQLLMHHHNSTTSYAKPDIKHLSLQAYLNTLGYPVISKNYAITNGGKFALYNKREQIIKFKLTGWTYLYGWGNYNSIGTSTIFKGSRQGFGNDKEIKVNGQMALENGAGGWIGALYSLNYQKDNTHSWGDVTDDKIHGQKSNFIPTASAFGMEVTRNNVFLSHENYTNINDFSSGKIRTSFDGIHGMENNEEHMKISIDTKDVVVEDWLRPDNTITQRPIVRYGESINQTADDPVAYVVKEEIAFGGNGNTFTFKKGADANVVSGQRIKFLPGFSIKEGAIMSARIEAIENNTILKRSEFKQSDSRNYLKNSPYYKKVHDYSISENTPIDITPLKLSVFPNPASSKVQFILSGEKPNNVVLAEIYDLNGKLLFTDNIFSDITYTINISNWAEGLYILKISTNKGVVQSKIVKT